ncbi:hypothetical protein [Mycolicibacterium aubagnense]|uniref:Uncharacterized protein n=1 Tax=Mycolicibacterium aubagnense TaxID=319707 RepID=A0ABM7I6K6_9MYCO|nr:hypothetical protein [Mycolicibacterium aubagnense]BBX82183.1 hypothetical protein MAUB_00560 [Mycolicibacterium aubagnense]
MILRTFRVYRAVRAETAGFAASDELVAREAASESEARARGVWGAVHPADEVSVEYVGEMSGAEYAAAAQHTRPLYTVVRA